MTSLVIYLTQFPLLLKVSSTSQVFNMETLFRDAWLATLVT